MDVPIISRDELWAKINNGDAFALVEALPKQYFRHTHLPGAVNLPPDEVRALAPTLLPDLKAEIVVYCADLACPASEKVARELAAMGYENVRDYQGGKADWVAAGLPVEKHQRRPVE